MAVKPHPTYYYGRQVVRVHEHKTNKWEWSLELEGGIYFKNTDKKRTKAPDDEEISGQALLTAVDYGPDDPTTTLRFGNTPPNSPPNFVVDVVMTTGKWTISDPRESLVMSGEHVQDVIEAPSESLPPDPSEERVEQGPDGGPPEPSDEAQEATEEAG